MHPHIEKLYSIAQKPERVILGLMSGTSLDGLDIALCKLSGSGKSTQCELLHFTTLEYDDTYRNHVKQIFASADGSIEHLCLLHPWIGKHHARLVNQALDMFQVKAEDVDIIASHGQTIYHCPQSQHGLSDFGNATLQLGDADHLAVDTGIITISDFRQKHIAAGGEGAPLVKYGDYLLFHNHHENRIMLNIGGIANLSYLPASATRKTVFSSDIGPGNTMMDALVQKHCADIQFDKDAELARQGKVCAPLLEILLSAAFLKLPYPKTTGPEVFNLGFLEHALKEIDLQAHATSNVKVPLNLSFYDQLATLCEFSARCIKDSIAHLSQNLKSAGMNKGEDLSIAVYVSGGGIHNPLLMERIQALLHEVSLSNKVQYSVQTTNALTLNPDAKEAVLFALLANETLCSNSTDTELDRQSACEPDLLETVTMGKISFPD